MPSDVEAIQTIKAQALTMIGQLTASPKPTYSLDGQTLSWSDYLTRLQKTVDWCERKLAGAEPFEIQSQGVT